NPKRLCESIVERDRARSFDALGIDQKFRRLSRQVCIGVVGRKRHVDGACFACRHADELLLETWNECTGTDIDPDIATRAAFERRAVDLAGKIDYDTIALFDL